MKDILILLAFLFSVTSTLFAKEAIKVDRVDFNSLRDDWIQMEVELSCHGNPSPEAIDKRFVEKIKVKAYLAYARDASARIYDYYTSEVEIIIMEWGDENNVYFYLPGLIVERDTLPTDPELYYVEISVNGKSQTPQNAAKSSNISNSDILNAFISNVESDGADNDYILTPIYLMSSGADLGRVNKLPAFLRRDVRE